MVAKVVKPPSKKKVALICIELGCLFQRLAIGFM